MVDDTTDRIDRLCLLLWATGQAIDEVLKHPDDSTKLSHLKAVRSDITAALKQP